MQKRNLIICPNCRREGITNVLGEVNEFGHFLVLRFHKGTTKIIGDNFGVACGKCEELVYIKKGGKSERKNFNFRLIGVSRFKVKTAYLAGTGSEKARKEGAI